MANETKSEVQVSTKSQADTTEPKLLHTYGAMKEVERLFNQLAPHNWMRSLAWGWPGWGDFEEALGNLRVPALDVVDRDKEVLVRVELPGVEKKDLNISIDDSTLTIKGSTCQETKDQRKNYFRCEIQQGNFSRAIPLPSGVEKDKISAHLKDGMLEIILPKVESTQRRNVEVK